MRVGPRVRFGLRLIVRVRVRVVRARARLRLMFSSKGC